jgi:Protein of unknown function (DUF935)
VTSSVNGSTSPIMDDVPVAAPDTGQERGSIFDLLKGDLVFDEYEDGAVFDYGEPTVRDLEQMLDRDGKARSLEQVLCLPIEAASWSIKAETGYEDVATFVEDALSRSMTEGGMQTPITDIIGQLTSAFTFRRAYFEKVFKRWGMRIIYDKVAYRPPATCVMKRDWRTGDLRGFKQEAQLGHDSEVNSRTGTDGYIHIKPQYSMVYVHGTKRSPVRGMSDLTIAWNCHMTKQKVKFLWFTFLESQMLPRTIFHASGDTAAKQGAEVIASLKNAGVAGIPKSWGDKVTQLAVAGQGAAEFRNALNWLDSEASSSLLAGFTDLASKAAEGAGSYALSKDQSDLFLHLLKGYAAELSSCVTNYMVSDLVRYNFGFSVPVPRFEIGPLNPDDVQMSLDLLKTLITSPDAPVPRAFVNDLVMEVARVLDMDMDQMRVSIEERERELSERANTDRLVQLAGVMATADVGAQAAAQAQQIKQQQQAKPAPKAQGGGSSAG